MNRFLLNDKSVPPEGVKNKMEQYHFHMVSSTPISLVGISN